MNYTTLGLDLAESIFHYVIIKVQAEPSRKGIQD